MIQKALELVKTGLGMPAFVSDKSYIQGLVDQGCRWRRRGTMPWRAVWT